MGARLTETMHGMLLWDERCGVDGLEPLGAASTASDYTEGTPRPGRGVSASSDALLSPVMLHEQGVDVDLEVCRGGLATIDGCQVLYSLDDGTTWVGRATPTWLSHYSPIIWSTSDTYTHDMVVLPQTQTLIVGWDDGSEVGCRVYDPDDATWSSTAQIRDTTAQIVAMCTAPGRTDRAICLAGSSTDGLDVYYSDDQGSSWAVYARSIVTPSADGRAVAATTGDEVILLVWDTTGTDVEQYASYDLLSSMVSVATLSSATDPQVVTLPSGGCLIGYLASATGYPTVRRIGSASEDVSDAEAVTVYDTAASDTYALAVDHSGRVWMVIEDGGEYPVYYSDDEGQTWVENVQIGGWQQQPFILDGSGTTRPDHWRAAFHRGHMVCAANHLAPTATTDGSLHALFLGGCHGGDVQWYRGMGDADDLQWLPYDVPDAVSAAWTQTGSQTMGVGAGGYGAISTTSQDGYYASAPGHDFTDGPHLLLIDVQMVSGGSAVADNVAARYTYSDGADEVDVRIRLTTTQYAVRVNGSTLHTDTVDLTERLQIAVWITASKSGSTDSVVMTMRRRPYEVDWVLIDTFGVNVQAGTGDRFDFGHLASSTASSRWYFAGVANNHPAPGGALDGTDTWVADRTQWYGLPGSGEGHPVPGAGTASGEARLRLSGGPGIVSETYTLDAEHVYPVEACLPDVAPSPDTPWRSEDTSEQIVVWDLGEDSWIGQSIALYVAGCNWRTGYLERWTGSTWATVGTIDLGTGLTSLEYTRDGETLRVDTGSTSDADRYLYEGELVGGTVLLDGSTARRIRYQSAGGWTQTSTVEPVIVMEGVDDGSDPASGSCVLVAPAGLHVVHPSSSPGTRYWRLRIPSQTVADSYLQTGIAMLGRLLVYGAAPSWTESDSAAPQVERQRDAYGTPRTRQLGPVRRTWQLDWQDSLVTLEHRGSIAPDYLGPSSGLAAAAAEDVWLQLLGVLERQRGGELPVVGIRDIPDTSDVTITDRSRLLYGELTSSVAGNVMSGLIGTDEVVRVEAITIEEIV